MKVEIEYTPESNIGNFAKEHNLTMIVREESYHKRFTGKETFLAWFKDVEIKGKASLTLTIGIGSTPGEAVNNYAKKIEIKTLVVSGESAKRYENNTYEIEVAKLTKDIDEKREKEKIEPSYEKRLLIDLIQLIDYVTIFWEEAQKRGKGINSYANDWENMLGRKPGFVEKAEMIKDKYYIEIPKSAEDKSDQASAPKLTSPYTHSIPTAESPSKPPLGIMPEALWDEERIINIAQTINRYIQAGRFHGINAITVGVWCEELSRRLQGKESKEKDKPGYPLSICPKCQSPLPAEQSCQCKQQNSKCIDAYHISRLKMIHQILSDTKKIIFYEADKIRYCLFCGKTLS